MLRLSKSFKRYGCSDCGSSFCGCLTAAAARRVSKICPLGPKEFLNKWGLFSSKVSKVRITYVSCTKEGKTHANEDRAFHVPDLTAVENAPPVHFTDTIGYAGVFDGHGGHHCSDYLSKAMHRRILAQPDFEKFEDAERVLMNSFVDSEVEFTEVATQLGDTSGSCAIAALIDGLDVTIAHAGDCRAVLRTGNKITELTRDHRPSVPSEKSRIKSVGGHISGGRVQGVLAPSRSFGDLDVKETCKDAVIATPDLVTLRVEVDKSSGFSFLVLATDGVWDAMSTEKAMTIVHKMYLKTKSASAAAAALVEQAALLNSDDVTVVLIIWTAEG